MFEAGNSYTITMDLAGEQTTYGRCVVKRVEMPLIEVTGMREGPDWETGTTILNTHSTAFVSAEPCPHEGETARTLEEWLGTSSEETQPK